MFDPNDTCDECHVVIPPDGEMFEGWEGYICKDCYERHMANAERLCDEMREEEDWRRTEQSRRVDAEYVRRRM